MVLLLLLLLAAAPPLGSAGTDAGPWSAPARSASSKVLPPAPGLVLTHARARAGLQRAGPLKTDEDAPAECDVLEHGAVGDNATDDGAAIQRAIWSCAGPGRGAVLLRKPHVFASSPLELPSHTSLVIEAGAILTPALSVAQWPNSTHGETCSVNWDEAGTVLRPQLANFVWSGNSTDVMITGGGEIDGRGPQWWDGEVRKEPWWCAPTP